MLFVLRTVYEAAGFADGPPLLEHLKTIEDLQVFLLPHGTGVDEVVKAARQISYDRIFTAPDLVCVEFESRVRRRDSHGQPVWILSDGYKGHRGTL